MDESALEMKEEEAKTRRSYRALSSLDDDEAISRARARRSTTKTRVVDESAMEVEASNEASLDAFHARSIPLFTTLDSTVHERSLPLFTTLASTGHERSLPLFVELEP